jgi:flagellar motor switch protein FliN/FliY
MEVKETAEHIAQWLAEEWGHCFTSVMEAMADQKPTVTCDGVAHPFTAAKGAFHSVQELSLGPECVIRISVPELVWHEAGGRVLKAAGIEEVSREDALGTFHEILSQALSGVAQAITGRVGHEVTCGARTDPASLPEDTTGLFLSITLPDAELADHPVFISAAPALLEQLLGAGEAPEAEAQVSAVEPHAQSPGPSSISKTFDLLLGVHLPVSVSFGKTTLMVKEVLKLTTGSIVELNRAVSEPVEIIVNNCVIARGEVVVVAGNYGVRVREIVSREQRYQTGIRPALNRTY